MNTSPVPDGAVSSAENPYLPENMLDPLPFYERMRQMPPAVWLEEVGVWGVFQDKYCREILMDPDRFGSAGGGGVANYYREKPWREPSVVFEVDPPDHTRTRRVLSRILSPRAVKEMSDRAEELAGVAVRKVLDMGEFDVVTDLAKPVVMQLVPDAVGIQEEDRENILLYNRYLLKGRGYGRHDPWTQEEVEESERVVRWVQETCSRDRVASAGFGSQIYAAADAGDISEYEANMLVRSFLSAGTDTTFGSISMTFLLLMQNPSQWEKLKAQPELARGAFDECLRIRSPAQTIARNTRQALDFHGTKMGEHDKIILFTGAANHDPDKWEDPDEFRIERKTIGHLGLGIGIHGCVGQMIARMEAEKVIGEFARQAEGLSFAAQPFRMGKTGRIVESLPVVATRRTA